MLKQLKKCLECEKRDEKIFDIVVYGSSVKGKRSPRDVDIAVIFLEGNLHERLDKIQAIKRRLKPLNIAVDIKQVTLKDLFSSEFLARTGILSEGISIFKNKRFSELLGYKPYSIFSYELKGLSHTQKVKFNYILSGRNSMKGVIKELNGERISSGAIKIPIENSIEFEEVLKANKINYKKKDVLESI